MFVCSRVLRLVALVNHAYGFHPEYMLLFIYNHLVYLSVSLYNICDEK